MEFRNTARGSATAAAATSLTTPGVIWLLRRADLMDQPNHRSSHSIPTPRGGGLSCLVGAGVGAAVLGVRGETVSWKVAGSSTVLALVGFLDDRIGLPAPVRLGAQVLVGAITGASRAFPGGALLGALVTPIVVNAVNFMDGINGITACTAGAWGLVSLRASSLMGDGSVGTSGALMLGVAAGFLPWNAPLAKIFLGDVGSYFLGGVIASTALVAERSTQAVPPLATCVVLSPLAPYLADTGLTLVRRAHRREPLFEAHRNHFYQKLVDSQGWTHTRVAALFGAGALASGILVGAVTRRAFGAGRRTTIEGCQ